MHHHIQEGVDLRAHSLDYLIATQQEIMQLPSEEKQRYTAQALNYLNGYIDLVLTLGENIIQTAGIGEDVELVSGFFETLVENTIPWQDHGGFMNEDGKRVIDKIRRELANGRFIQ